MQIQLTVKYVMQCNVKLRKLLGAHKSHVRETSLFTGAIPNPVRNSQTPRFVSVPGKTRIECLLVVSSNSPKIV